MSKLPIANKDLGQHFLNDETIIEKITSDFSDIADVILEVGPGPAVLTKVLAKLEKPLAVVEKDRRMLEYIKEHVEEKNIFFMDALKLNEEQLLNDLGWSERRVWLVSNLPYNIASPLIVNFLQWSSIDQMTLMVQKEVGLKIIGKSAKGKDDMNSLHALCSVFFKVSELCKVPPEAFLPPPKVDSMVVSFERREIPEIKPEEFNKFEKFLRALFRFRRKQVYNVLKSQYDPEKLDLAFTRCNIPRTARAETFKRAEIQLLYSYLTS
ncbi:MAG: 16S rRNA (adenine1518-N6/adenine1519-N6)-dimethyltransferase [Bacteriovoracaceae bacterium]